MLLSCMLCGSCMLCYVDVMWFHCVIVEITSKICYAPLCHDVVLVVYRQRKLHEIFFANAVQFMKLAKFCSAIILHYTVFTDQ